MPIFFGKKKQAEPKRKKTFAMEYMIGFLLILSSYWGIKQLERKINFKPKEIIAINNIVLNSKKTIQRDKDLFSFYRKIAGIKTSEQYDFYETYVPNSKADKIYVIINKDNKKNVCFFYKDQTLKETFVDENNKFIKSYKAFLKNKRMIKVNFYNKDNKIIKTVFYNRFNKPLSKVFLQDEKIKSGIYSQFDDNYRLKKQSEYENFQKNGYEIIYNDKNQVKKRIKYKNGQKIGLVEFFEDNKKIFDQFIKDSVLRLERKFSKKGELLWSERYSQNGNLDGYRIRFDKDNNKIFHACYQDGKLHGKFFKKDEPVKWYWMGTFLGVKEKGKKAFDNKLFVLQKKFSCPFSDEFHKNNKSSLEKGKLEKKQP